ncbi:MAG: hypothetical protein A2W61_01630 [Deltaproteobacteria bacterium RIFCSPLOWO2_01_44_7]|nr:MAG: hypothetical protein A2W61_01630 [Deltaproteobacteria bacterium RIFCSPLOWO2_01_44_7]
MKKLFITTLALGLLFGTASFAEDSVAGGFEASGHIVTGAGWQRYKVAGAAGTAIAFDVNGTAPGVIGQYSTGGLVNRDDEFKFFVDEVELDIAKTFGENIRVRADLDFGSQTMHGGPRFNDLGTALGGTGVGVLLEQAYATANLSIGNGLEVLLGRFNAPLGFESVDTNKNDTISKSILYRALRPNTFTGVKLYYAFSDLVDWHFYLANNNLTYDDGDALNLNTDIPALGFRLGFNWGEEGKKSTLGWSGAVGQDRANIKRHMSFLGDVDWQWWATDNFAIGGEGIYRQINNTRVTAGSTKNGKYFGALLNLHYDFSDVWDGTLKYAWAHDVNGITSPGLSGLGTDVGVTNVFGGGPQSLTGADQMFHEITVAGNYMITDGAKLKLEGGYTLINPTGPANKQHTFGLGGAFAYEF